MGVRFFNSKDDYSSRTYYYNCRCAVENGDLVVVKVYDFYKIAKVVNVLLPEDSLTGYMQEQVEKHQLVDYKVVEHKEL